MGRKGDEEEYGMEGEGGKDSCVNAEEWGQIQMSTHKYSDGSKEGQEKKS